MDRTPAVWERCVWDRLTTIKLAMQILERRTRLSDYQHDLARTAIEAADSLTAELLARQDGEGE